MNIPLAQLAMQKQHGTDRDPAGGTHPPLILVHQMAKVASLAWVEASRPAAARWLDLPAHSHFIVDKNLDRLAQSLAMRGEHQTIRNAIIPRDIVRKGRAAAAAMADARARGRALHVICGMRDPVDRSLSLFSFLADFCGHTRQPLSGREAGAAVATAVEILKSTWESVYSPGEPAASFEWLLFRMIGLFRTWFHEELLEPLGVDVRQSAFPKSGGALRVRRHDIDVLLYRVEDMNPAAPAYEALRDDAAAFLGIPRPEWPAVNRSESRQRSWDFNERVRNSFCLPPRLLDTIYAEPIVTHCYSPEEIAAFRARWS